MVWQGFVEGDVGGGRRFFLVLLALLSCVN